MRFQPSGRCLSVKLRILHFDGFFNGQESCFWRSVLLRFSSQDIGQQWRRQRNNYWLIAAPLKGGWKLSGVRVSGGRNEYLVSEGPTQGFLSRVSRYVSTDLVSTYTSALIRSCMSFRLYCTLDVSLATGGTIETGCAFFGWSIVYWQSTGKRIFKR